MSVPHPSGIPNSKAISVQMPVNEMKLTNSSNITVPTNHDDHSLNEHIPLRGVFSGYVTFQMTVKIGENCALLLDPTWDNSISVNAPNLNVNEVDYGSQTWTIRYKPLIKMDTSTGSPDYAYPSIVNFDDLSPSADAPTPLNLPGTTSGYWEGYWQLMARYVWKQVLYTNNP
jgi:hypothetical protein